MWFHVDGAYGGFFSMTESAGNRFVGLNRADSIILDPHKGMFLPYGAGAVLIKDGRKMQETFGDMKNADYLQDRDGLSSNLSPMDYTLELTRPFRSAKIVACTESTRCRGIQTRIRRKASPSTICRT